MTVLWAFGPRTLWLDAWKREALADVFRQLGASTVIHGAAPGADSVAGEVAESCGIRVTVFPAEWERFGKSAGMRRSTEMARFACAARGRALCLKWAWQISRGTAHAVGLTRSFQLPVSTFEVLPSALAGDPMRIRFALDGRGVLP